MDFMASRGTDQVPTIDHRPAVLSRSRSDEAPQPSTSAPSLKDVAFLAATAPHITLSPAPRLPLPARSHKGPLRRPSTASSAEEKFTLLPSSDLGTPGSTASSDSYDGERMRLGSESPLSEASIQEVNRRAHAAMAGLRAEASKLSGSVDMLPSPFDPSPSDEPQAHNLRLQHEEAQVDYDWATFISAYALGRWNPLKTPHPPRSQLQPPTLGSTSRSASRTSEGLDICDSPDPSSPVYSWDSHNSEAHSLKEASKQVEHDPSKSAPPQYQLPLHVPTASAAPSPVPQLPDVGIASRRATMPLNLGFAHRLRNSFADIRSSGGYGSGADIRPTISNTDITTSAATIRLAAARVSVAPLALPSPEHELTDPFRGVTATIPGSHPSDLGGSLPTPPLKSPNLSRKTRLSSFWQGTQDVEESRLPTIEASPPEWTEDHSSSHSPSLWNDSSRKSSNSFPFVGSVVPPATAPVRYSDDKDDDDYFGSIEGHKGLESVSSDSDMNSIGTQASTVTRLDHDVARHASAPPFDSEPSTVPALPRRICLTRQTSAPLPTLTMYEKRMRTARPASESSALSHVGRSAKEEQMFSELGYLAPPNPPDELERRRALYKFNIWNTGHDMNFDRIAHLVKLVFSTRIVTISLVDGTEEFFKSESGFGVHNMPRTSSFNAHAILQRDDEPTIVLDAQDDWRFAGNPLVIGHPHIRFYAGCPLRTQDGYNIGVLSIIDDTPRREFSPRQRHTLKEFAQIAMRELELWRDKIQLRIRDRIQNSMEEFTRECLEVDKDGSGERPEGRSLFVGTSMEQVYERAARLVKRTLDVEGAIVMDVSHVDVLETVGAESTTSISIHSDDPQFGSTNRTLNADEYTKLQDFFSKSPDGKICEGVLPAGLRPFLPSRIQYALAVPIFNIDKRPFAILCAYSTGERTTPFLEGHELSYLRAIGVIILSAVLKRRMILADKAKSLFISNISHELRTPLHGILASAELLSETSLDHSQASFLQTVQACGTSLVETVNHVLDFTKLSGNARSGGVENVIQRSRVDIMQLVEEATEGCWIGHRARMFTSEIGSVYSPPKQDRTSSSATTKWVETVIDVDHNDLGWVFKCEKGGIRRVLMNLFGNSLKFTSDGYVHVMLRQQPPVPDQPDNMVKIELSVIDTGKGISQSFLKNQLFHPFSQENPLQTGTGLGLAIVNSIVRSKSVDGKVDVWSAEGVGTEIKVTFTAELVDDAESRDNDAELRKVYDSLHRPSISLAGFDDPHRGIQLLRNVLSTYLVKRWGLILVDDKESADIIVVNEDYAYISRAIQEKRPKKPFMVLSSNRGDPNLMGVVSDYEKLGGFCRVVYKPAGPCRIASALKLCLHALNITKASANTSLEDLPASGIHESPSDPGDGTSILMLPRRYSEELAKNKRLSNSQTIRPALEQDEPREQNDGRSPSPVFTQSPSSPTIAIGTGGTLLKSSAGTLQAQGLPIRVLVVEDNAILRGLLVKWLRSKGYEYREATDGLEGVQTFESEGHFDVVLVDLSMPVLDGVGATVKMRDCEALRKKGGQVEQRAHDARILALTGMSSLEDKRRAFDAGVDGYLVKPVAFKTLDMMFHKLGLS
ncbi:Signal transduction histidine kinase [Phanerochaete sordida]|uniref:histidine kinase n=1 Tax=Phanerochaete sordida TaxID=48140 RepID=A0A9P3LHB4_9APHY|nr:Signal transduction histidine kinase [Phanerochaete sordida]